MNQSSELSTAFDILDAAIALAPGTRKEHELRSKALDYVAKQHIAALERIKALEEEQTGGDDESADADNNED